MEVKTQKPVGLHGSRIGPIPGENVKLGYRTRKCKKLTVNHLHGSSLKEHVQHGSWKTETKNAYVEVTWRSKHQVDHFYVNMFSPHVEYILLGRSLKPPDWPPHHLFSSLHLSSHPRHAGHPYLKNNHQRVQVWIQHQKFTNRAFYIKSLIKKKNIWKTWFGIHVFSFFLGNEILLRSMGNPSTKPKVLPWIAWFFNMALRSMFGDSSLELLVAHILKATIKGSKPEFNTKSWQIEHFI